MTARRSDHSPAQKTAARARSSPLPWLSEIPPESAEIASTPHPVESVAPALVSSEASEAATSRKSTTPVSGE